MVMIALDHAILTDINGKFGGGHYKYDKCGLHFQTNPPRRKAPTEYELEQRKFFRSAQRHWSQESFEGTYNDRYSWTYYGRQHPKQNKKGETKALSGFNAFLSVNIPRLIEGQPVLYHAPGITDPPPPPRLKNPTIEIYNTPPWGCYILIVFPQPMETGLVYTPPLADFTLTSVLLDLISSKIGEFKPVSKTWVNAWSLHLDFNIQISPSLWHFGYKRGNRAFETAAAPARNYGSFGK